MIAKRLTENSWITQGELGNYISLVFKRDGFYISSHNLEKIYSSLKEIAQEFKEKLIEKTIQEEKTKTELGGFPVRHQEIFDPKNIDTIPTYKTKADSNIRFVAGWWVVYAEGKYRVSCCPKESTINEHCSGPFVDKFNANVILAKVKNVCSDD